MDFYTIASKQAKSLQDFLPDNVLNLLEQPDSFIALSMTDQTLVSLCVFTWSGYPMDIAKLLWIYTLPEYRMQGHSNELLQYLGKEFKDLQVPGLEYIAVKEPNVNSPLESFVSASNFLAQDFFRRVFFYSRHALLNKMKASNFNQEQEQFSHLDPKTFRYLIRNATDLSANMLDILLLHSDPSHSFYYFKGKKLLACVAATVISDDVIQVCLAYTHPECTRKTLVLSMLYEILDELSDDIETVQIFVDTPNKETIYKNLFGEPESEQILQQYFLSFEDTL